MEIRINKEGKTEKHTNNRYKSLAIVKKHGHSIIEKFFPTETQKIKETAVKN